MLLYLILVYLSRNATHAAPLSLFSRDSFDVNPASDPSTRSCPDQRSIWDILWSCLTTIFSCSWVSVHPNIPGLDESRIKITLRRLELMFWAIAAPEMVIFWAIRQWIGARSLAQQWKGQGWTRTHGYFIQMGGFMLYQGNEPQSVLSPKRLEELTGEGKIDFPTITEKEIQDRSKADALSKALVIGQTTWFILQCFARAVQHLEITQLELLTAALAFLNAFMYGFWWNKPLDVQTPVPVYLLDEPLELDLRAEPIRLNPQSSIFKAHLDSHRDTTPSPVPFWQKIVQIGRIVITCPTVRDEKPWIQRLQTSFRDAAKRVNKGISSAITRLQEFLKEKGYAQAVFALLIGGPWNILMLILSRLSDMSGGIVRSDIIDEGQVRIPTFYALSLDLDSDVHLSVSAIAMVFGAIHCAGWNLAFPSATEAWIWRISSIAISVTPLLFLLTVLFGLWDDRAEEGSLAEKFAKGLNYLVVIPTLSLFPVYILARILLLVEAFIGLRALAPGALAVVKWTSFLPHI